MPSSRKHKRGRNAGVAILSREELEAMSTRELLGRLERLRRCEEDPLFSDMSMEEVSVAVGVVFKTDPAWSKAVGDIRDVLALREHVPSGPERRAARQARTARNRSAERHRR